MTSTDLLKGKTALVSGGSTGIGRAIATALAARGARVVLTSRSLATAQDVAKEIGVGVTGLACELRDPQSVDRLFADVREKFGSLDILINNAGMAGPNKQIADLPIETWREIIDTNLTGPFLVTRAALPLMRPGGTVLFVLSVAARVVFSGMSAYAAAKNGARVLADTLREELRPRKIRVISVMPGATDTDIWQQFWPDAPRAKMMSPESIAESAVSAILLPENVTVNEIVIMPTGGAL